MQTPRGLYPTTLNYIKKVGRKVPQAPIARVTFHLQKKKKKCLSAGIEPDTYCALQYGLYYDQFKLTNQIINWRI